MKKTGICTLLAVALISAACTKDNDPIERSGYDSVVILYSEGYNNLSSDLRKNVGTICKGALPMKSSPNALVLVAHNAVSDIDFKTPVRPVIVRISSDWHGNAVLDTIKVFEPEDRLTDKDLMRSALSFISDEFKSEHYGILFSSHGTGWLPANYYSKPTIPRLRTDVVKSIGQSYEGTASDLKYSYELEIPDLAQAIPMHLDYLIFDACLMGGIEVAYELKDCTDIIGFSQAEILATGFDYSTFSQRLLIERDPVAFCRDFYDFYESGKGSSKSATVSVINTGGLDGMALLCSRLFERYREGIDSADKDSIQGFFSSDKHWFFDLEDILVKSGLSDEDHRSFSDALKECVIYEAHTASIRGLFNVSTSCGFSSFLPSTGTSRLRNYYKTLSWNKATGLVK